MRYDTPDYVNEFIEDELEFDNIENGIEIHSEVFDKDLDDADWEPHTAETEETEDIFGYYE